MHIQEIIIDGFKSYAQRTVIEGFDPHFNAITGLNGSGKSNILDAICFVLGITNLSQVRAGNLSELVYKQGQAGVNKATVTIIFNNEDEKNSPVGYEQCHEVTVTRQVLIGGKSKYMINGRNAPANQVQNLFHSVQLNVNNPHFLIMQGRITKVLNMKPNEILGMVEEAAGTRMYETKRVAALKTIDKKQLKLDELNRVLSEEITPTLNRLRDERENYLRWSKIDADIQRDERFVIAYEFVKAQKALDKNSEGTAGIEGQIAALEEKANEFKKLIQEKEKEIEERVDEMKGELDDQYTEAKKEESELSKALVKATSNWKNTETVVAKAEEDVNAARAQVKESKDAVASKEAEIQSENGRIEDKIKAAEEAETRHKQLEIDFQNMNAGISSSEGNEGGTLPEQISKAHSASKAAEAKVKQAKMRIDHLTKELKKVEKDIKKQGDSSDKLSKKREAAVSKVEKVKAEIDKLEFDSDRFNVLESEKSELESSVSELGDLVDTLSAKLQGRLSFQYSDPVRGFDRSKVKGLVAKLVQVKDAKYSTALEVVAGGKLYQVVVDEAITGKALLERGQLKRRVTIIPLDKIKSKQVPARAADKASEIASGLSTTAQPAIELVGYDEEVRSAIEFVFGSSIVVDGMKAANQICDVTKTRTVTLEGDVYDPTGTISGGSSSQLGSTLSTLTQLTEASSQLEQKKEALKAVCKEYDQLNKSSSAFEKLASKLEVAETELQAVDKHLSQTSFGMLIESRDKMNADLDSAEQECIDMEREQQEKWNLYEELKEKESELTQQREERLVEMERAVKEAKADAAAKSKLAREIGSQSQTLTLELESLRAEVAAAEEAVVIAEKALKQALDEESDAQMKVGDVQAQYESAKEQLESLEAIRTERSSVLVTLKNEKADFVKEQETATLEAKKLSVSISRMDKERSSAEKVVASMMKQHPWIQSDMKTFGVEGGNYDFSERDPEELSKTLQSLRSEHEKLSKSVNKKVMGMFDKANDEYKELLRKRKVVEGDKKKIQDVIEELDEKKKTELEETWVKVNRDFGSIFSTLLPGAFAKLEPPEGMQAWEGLEVKVAFGDVWKESLSELSGGQRSLLALSLILSLLLFKPAPMYILDEVDAALDLSHTQNIGNMLKTHFSQSQFIVVSLKEGMFNNANVIFRTKFVEGVSTVTRTIGTGSSRARLLESTENQDEDVSAAKTSRARSSNKRRGKENAV